MRLAARSSFDRAAQAMVAQSMVRAVAFVLGSALVLLPAGARARRPDTGSPHAAAAAPTASDEEGPAERAARLGLGGRDAANVLLLGPPRSEWVEAAGGGERADALLWPLDGGRLLRGFGSGRWGRHRALDIGAPEGAPIRAAERGIVAYADRTVRGYGRLVMLVHPGGWVTFYSHASELLVQPGQLVARGEVIARVGHSGRALGDHLHFELRDHGVKVDPSALLRELPSGLRLPATPPGPPTRTVRVRRGDTLIRIARRHGVTVRQIVALNGRRRTARLRIGQEIVVPRR
jgi:murein DD-endopeptidase MepM/ murein hydrolase activator NlpD